MTVEGDTAGINPFWSMIPKQPAQGLIKARRSFGRDHAPSTIRSK